jgi:hypothetical protein
LPIEVKPFLLRENEPEGLPKKLCRKKGGGDRRQISRDEQVKNHEYGDTSQ